MRVEITTVCGNTCIKAEVKQSTRQHLNDLLWDNGIIYLNRPDNRINIYIDDALNASKLSQVVRWLEKAEA